VGANLHPESGCRDTYQSRDNLGYVFDTARLGGLLAG
jgi:hypothetical protein